MPSGATRPPCRWRADASRLSRFCVVPAEAVERDENEIMLILGPRRVGAVVDMRERERRIEAGSLSLGRKRKRVSPRPRTNAARTACAEGRIASRPPSQQLIAWMMRVRSTVLTACTWPFRSSPASSRPVDDVDPSSQRRAAVQTAVPINGYSKRRSVNSTVVHVRLGGSCGAFHAGRRLGTQSRTTAQVPQSRYTRPSSVCFAASTAGCRPAC